MKVDVRKVGVVEVGHGTGEQDVLDLDAVDFHELDERLGDLQESIPDIRAKLRSVPQFRAKFVAQMDLEGRKVDVAFQNGQGFLDWIRPDHGQVNDFCNPVADNRYDGIESLGNDGFGKFDADFLVDSGEPLLSIVLVRIVWTSAVDHKRRREMNGSEFPSVFDHPLLSFVAFSMGSFGIDHVPTGWLDVLRHPLAHVWRFLRVPDIFYRHRLAGGERRKLFQPNFFVLFKSDALLLDSVPVEHGLFEFLPCFWIQFLKSFVHFLGHHAAIPQSANVDEDEIAVDLFLLQYPSFERESSGRGKQPVPDPRQQHHLVVIHILEQRVDDLVVIQRINGICIGACPQHLQGIPVQLGFVFGNLSKKREHPVE